MNIKSGKFVFSMILFIVIGLLFVVYLWLQGMFIPNDGRAEQYPIKGVDVSSYQGKIDWPILQKELQFAFIKATEGSGFVDPYFKENWNEANETKLRVGAYHFFSFDSSGATQADNFIKAVPVKNTSLPPVIDVEFYADKEKNPPDPANVKKELQAMIGKLKAHYGKNVILYTTVEAYELYIKNDFEQCDIWIRDVFSKPNLPDQREWTFWQYTDRETLEGYLGEEKFIDVNVFHGSKREFELYGK